ncbi:hypothetical protein [Lysinibacillus sp. 54212]|uniref:hypothetical protein n=1 Tax=Lysinibacillus sp. 54212 TaxID=3119829 RepID=UPI002FCB746B
MEILLIVLFILQLISFYLIILLNSKIARFKDLEIRQDQVIREMDNSIGAYLMELKEENDRLIKELSKVQQAPTSSTSFQQPVVEELPKPSAVQGINTGLESVLLKGKEPAQLELTHKTLIPKTFAANAYNKQQGPTDQLSNKELPVEQKEQDDQFTNLSLFEREVIRLHKEGKTIEEIAKKTQKGKTEIELLIKFHS